MVFSTPFFLFLFLPLFLLVYYAVPGKGRNWVILAGSWLFYGFWRLDFLALVIFTSFMNYLFGRWIVSAGLDQSKSRRRVVSGVIFNLLILGYFKYFNFGVDSFNALLGLFGVKPITALTIILPVGISFYIFQSMSYVIDVYRKDARPASGFGELAAYVALFPQLIAGPILRYKDIADQLKARHHSLSLFSQGFSIFAVGVCRKVLIADTLAPIVDSVFALESPSLVESWFGTAAYALQLYFDFTGYSDMAIGLGKMIGFHFRKNFDTPYLSLSITEFWRRWHISLSTWLRDYLYISLGGNRKGAGRTYVNLLMVMILGGFWHGASWNFLLWGAWHGVWLIAERRWSNILPQNGGWNLFRWFRTIVVVLIGWIFFRAADVGQIVEMVKGFSGFNGLGLTANLAWQLSSFSTVVFFISLGVIVLERVQQVPQVQKRERQSVFSLKNGRVAVLFVLFAFSLFKILADSYSPFLYFQF